jgi:hypothetical protein
VKYNLIKVKKELWYLNINFRKIKFYSSSYVIRLKYIYIYKKNTIFHDDYVYCSCKGCLWFICNNITYDNTNVFSEKSISIVQDIYF